MAQTAVPGVDAAAARDELDQVLSRVAADESRASYYVRRLVAYLQYRAGVSPLDPPGDPVNVLARDEMTAGHKADADKLYVMRDSKDPAGPRLYFTESEWEAFARGTKDGAFDDLS